MRRGADIGVPVDKTTIWKKILPFSERVGRCLVHNCRPEYRIVIAIRHDTRPMPFMIAPLRQGYTNIVEYDLTGYPCDRFLMTAVSYVGGNITWGAAIPHPYDLDCDAH